MMSIFYYYSAFAIDFGVYYISFTPPHLALRSQILMLAHVWKEIKLSALCLSSQLDENVGTTQNDERYLLNYSSDK
jgi:regulator of sirC expression with transglutaminase-like and TPR domain